jgi:hypothetical protein
MIARRGRTSIFLIQDGVDSAYTVVLFPEARCQLLIILLSLFSLPFLVEIVQRPVGPYY